MCHTKTYHQSSRKEGLTAWIKSIPSRHPNAKFVAIAKIPFAKGTERVAFECFEVAWDRQTILGPPMVVKESQMLHNGNGNSIDDARQNFVRKFCKT
jgi:hypothetical protein